MMNYSDSVHIKVRDIDFCGATNRAEINDQVVDELTKALKAGQLFFPPIEVVKNHSGKLKYWLIDGRHRCLACQVANGDGAIIRAVVYSGTQRDAVLLSLRSNHALPRSDADKRAAVLTMLTNKLVSTKKGGYPWSDHEIAEHCCVDLQLVSQVRIDPTASIKRQSVALLTRTIKPPAGPTLQTKQRHGQGHTLVSMPWDTKRAAGVLLDALGTRYAQSLVAELTNCMEGVNT